MESGLKARQRAASCRQAQVSVLARKEANARLTETLIGFKMPKFEPLMDPKQTRQDLMVGNKDAIYYLKAADPNYTQYLGTNKGLQNTADNHAQIIQRFYTTCAGMTSPDPAILSK